MPELIGTHKIRCHIHHPVWLIYTLGIHSSDTGRHLGWRKYSVEWHWKQSIRRLEYSQKPIFPYHGSQLPRTLVVLDSKLGLMNVNYWCRIWLNHSYLCRVDHMMHLRHPPSRHWRITYHWIRPPKWSNSMRNAGDPRLMNYCIQEYPWLSCMEHIPVSISSSLIIKVQGRSQQRDRISISQMKLNCQWEIAQCYPHQQWLQLLSGFMITIKAALYFVLFI